MSKNKHLAKLEQHEQDWWKRFKKRKLKNRKIYTDVTHVSRSGMSRRMRFFVHHPTHIEDITWRVANLVGYKRNDDGTITVGGCGMDMGFHMVYSIGRRLFPNGIKTSMNRNGSSERETDGGYCVKQQWL